MSINIKYMYPHKGHTAFSGNSLKNWYLGLSNSTFLHMFFRTSSCVLDNSEIPYTVHKQLKTP